MTTTPDPRVPVHLLSGWLGSGKTTLLNRFLAAPADLRFAVLVNEFGEIGIDDRTVVSTEEDLVELRSGCICCTVRGDLVEALAKLDRRRRGGLLRRAKPFDRVLIETTGLAEPAPLVRTLVSEPGVMEAFRPGTVIGMVDASNAERSLEEPSAREQVALADHLILNKCDLVDDERRREVENIVRRWNPLARLEHAVRADVDPMGLLEEPPHVVRFDVPAENSERPDNHDHLHDITSVSLRESRPVDRTRLRLWLDACVHLLGDRLLRYKGFVSVIDDPRRVVLQGVYDRFTLEPEGEWGEDSPATELVFIGRNLDRKFFERGLEASLG